MVHLFQQFLFRKCKLIIFIALNLIFFRFVANLKYVSSRKIFGIGVYSLNIRARAKANDWFLIEITWPWLTTDAVPWVLCVGGRYFASRTQFAWFGFVLFVHFSNELSKNWFLTELIWSALFWQYFFRLLHFRD